MGKEPSSLVLFFLALLLFPSLCKAQGVTVDLAKPINDVIDKYETQVHEALQGQLDKIEGLKDQAINTAIDKANPYKGQWEACMKSFQKCAQRISEVDLCPRSKAKSPQLPENFDEGEGAEEGEADSRPIISQQTMNCPDGSQPDYQAMALAAESCKIPANCETIAQKYMAGAMAGSIVGGAAKNIGTSLLRGAISNIPNIPGLPKIPFIP